MSRLIFTKSDWFASADILFPGPRDAKLEARLEAMWLNVERLDAEYRHRADNIATINGDSLTEYERKISANLKWINDNL